MILLQMLYSACILVWSTDWESSPCYWDGPLAQNEILHRPRRGIILSSQCKLHTTAGSSASMVLYHTVCHFLQQRQAERGK